MVYLYRFDFDFKPVFLKYGLNYKILIYKTESNILSLALKVKLGYAREIFKIKKWKSTFLLQVSEKNCYYVTS